MKVFVCFLSLVAAAVAGVIPNGIGAYSLNGLGQATYSVDGLGPLSGEGLVFTGPNENSLQTLELANHQPVVAGIDENQGLANALQILCPDQPQQANLQFVEPQVQVVEPQIQLLQPQLAEYNTFQVIRQAPQPAPEVNYLQLVRQTPAPPPEVRTVQIVREHAAPPPQIRTVQVIREHPAPAPEVRTIQLINEHGEAPAAIESNVEIQRDDSGAQTVRFIQDGEGGAEKVFRIVNA